MSKMLKRMELQFAEAAEKAKQSFASNDISETSVEIEDLSTDGDVEEVELEKEEVEAVWCGSSGDRDLIGAFRDFVDSVLRSPAASALTHCELVGNGVRLACLRQEVEASLRANTRVEISFRHEQRLLNATQAQRDAEHERDGGARRSDHRTVVLQREVAAAGGEHRGDGVRAGEGRGSTHAARARRRSVQPKSGLFVSLREGPDR